MNDICLGYLDEQRWETMSERERNATPLRGKNGNVSRTAGPYAAETKEQLGGVLVREATDLHHAIPWMSKHSGVQASAFEMRPAADLTAMIRDSARRRSAPKGNGT